MHGKIRLTFKEVYLSFKNWPKVFKLLWLADKKSIVIIMILNILIGLLPATLLLANQYLINSITLGLKVGFSIVIKALIIVTTLYVAEQCLNQAKIYFENIYRTKISNYVNLLLMKKSTSLALEDFENDEIYDQLQRAQGEANHRPYQIFSQILTIISSIITLVSTALILIIWKWWVVLCLLIMPLITALSFLKLGKQEFEMDWNRAPLLRKMWYFTYLLTKDISIKEVKLYSLGKRVITQYSDMYNKLLSDDKVIAKKRLSLSVITQVLNQFIVAGLMLVILLEGYTKKIMIGTAVSYMQALTATQNSLNSLLQQIFLMYENNLYIEQLFSFLAVEEKEFKDEEKAIILEEIESIQFKNVYFKYPGNQDYTLKNVSFSLKKGDRVAIVGKNGSGKSTLVKLLTRLYKNYNGQILINGLPIETYTTSSIRNKIGVIFQDFVKYELSARENITVGQDVSLNNDKEIYEVVERAGVDHLIHSLPNKLDTQLGKWFSDGYQLSGGQWQSIAIARALYKNADVYIFDEPSSALDAEAEQGFFQKLYETTNGKISLFISHRFSTVTSATKILVFKYGEIIEQGNHNELMNMNGHYCELYNMQVESYKPKMVSI
ncbi:ABC transporter ATP-binding protein [Priestia megaterium]|uniref:ABC transporter ATP-binding protein n=1 Tax=Priestia megaterium TaxID=1404 RepID=UPI00234F6711|nr:ABC transporter ATP-binding protein [Priestia megaterium]MDC7783998.1 ABC transporter ATP-binding protein [Priestia megaterium]